MCKHVWFKSKSVLVGALVVNKTSFGYFVGSFVLVALLPFYSATVAQGTDSPEPGAADMWLADIESLDQKLRQHHPDPFFRTGEGAWLENLAVARDLVEKGASDKVITTHLISAVANLYDGHTRLEPVEMGAFANWLPLRFYEFDEGLYVTVAAEQYADLVGKRLISISGTAIEKVLPKLAVATAGDNVFQVREGAAALLSNAGLLAALDLIEDTTEPVTLVFEDDGGNQLTQEIPTINSWYSVNYRNWGELFGPPFDPFDIYKTPFHGGKVPMAYRDPPNATDAPFYASRKPFWSRLDKDETVLTFQFNFFADVGPVTR